MKCSAVSPFQGAGRMCVYPEGHSCLHADDLGRQWSAPYDLGRQWSAPLPVEVTPPEPSVRELVAAKLDIERLKSELEMSREDEKVLSAEVERLQREIITQRAEVVGLSMQACQTREAAKFWEGEARKELAKAVDTARAMVAEITDERAKNEVLRAELRRGSLLHRAWSAFWPARFVFASFLACSVAAGVLARVPGGERRWEAQSPDGRIFIYSERIGWSDTGRVASAAWSGR